MKAGRRGILPSCEAYLAIVTGWPVNNGCLQTHLKLKFKVKVTEVSTAYLHIIHINVQLYAYIITYRGPKKYLDILAMCKSQ